MKNKKIMIILFIILAISAIAFGVFRATHSPDYLYSENGSISDGHKDLMEHLKNVPDEAERKNQIDFSLEQNLITQEEANQLY